MIYAKIKDQEELDFEQTGILIMVFVQFWQRLQYHFMPLLAFVSA